MSLSQSPFMLSILLILQHLRSYTNPAEQKWIVAVLFMVPVYATESILSLWNPSFSLACDILRNCYEAFALYSFGSYLIACLGGERKVIELLEDESRQMKEPLLEGEENPESKGRRICNFIFQPCVLGKDLLITENFGLMILKTVCAFLALILELFGVYGDGEFKWYYGYPYFAVVFNFSQMWALYCRVQEGKFQTGLQDFLICIEMAIAAVSHMFVFSAKPYHFIPASEHGKITSQKTEAVVKIEEDSEVKPTILEKTETEVEATGRSVKEGVQDIVVEGGQKARIFTLVVKDVVLTINQAIEPVERGVIKIQETFQASTTHQFHPMTTKKSESKG
ncbi:unnamed protein product [Coffea canephora]|uniref:Uncharacterized protein n=1 Tax=Coffea canephora TaxID=49390 RepID=A0A068U3H3_COFCA|nr:unnamed protein product [Coffea canephora]